MVPSCLQGMDAAGSLLPRIHPLAFITCPERSIIRCFSSDTAQSVILPSITFSLPFSPCRWDSALWSSAKPPAAEPR